MGPGTGPAAPEMAVGRLPAMRQKLGHDGAEIERPIAIAVGTRDFEMYGCGGKEIVQLGARRDALRPPEVQLQADLLDRRIAFRNRPTSGTPTLQLLTSLFDGRPP